MLDWAQYSSSWSYDNEPNEKQVIGVRQLTPVLGPSRSRFASPKGAGTATIAFAPQTGDR
jgi:hypothetical protein